MKALGQAMETARQQDRRGRDGTCRGNACEFLKSVLLTMGAFVSIFYQVREAPICFALWRWGDVPVEE